MALHPPARLAAELQARFGPRAVLTDPARIAPWLTDWRGRYHGAAVAILQPVDLAQVRAMVAAARQARVPLVPQGGNTSMVGGATPPADGSALILSTRRMTAIRRIADDHVVAEAGVVLQTLHDAAADSGRRFPLTLGARGSATIGGLVSTNAGGTQVLRHGTMRRLVAGVEAVLPDAAVVDTLSPLRKDTRGYDLTQLLVGAEGTLGIVTAASLRLVVRPGARGVAWVGLADPGAALALLRMLEATDTLAVEGFEILQADSLARVLAHLADAREPLAGSHPWHVLIEAVGEGDVATALAEALSAGLSRGLIADAVLARSEREADALWRLRDSISAAERAAGPAVQHDIAVPVDAMPAFMTSAAAALERAFPGTSAGGFGHLGDGNVHFHVRAPAGADAEAFHAGPAPAITRMVHDLVVAAGGSISAEHGIGQMKLGELARVEPPARLSALRAIKAAIDPLGLMNPGKLVPLAPGGAGT